MRIFTTIIIALRALRRNLMRSILTGLGMIIGVAAVIILMSMGNGAQAAIEAQIASLGDNLITVQPGSYTSGGVRSGYSSSSSLTVADAEAIRTQIPAVIGVTPESYDRVQVISGGLNWNTIVRGESADYPTIRSWPLSAGDFFGDQDVRTAAQVCILGQTVADQIFPDANPVGQTIRARNVPLRVLGVMKAKGFSTTGSDQDDFIIVPYTTAMKRVTKRDRISYIYIQAQDADSVERVQNEVKSLMQQRRQDRDPDYVVLNQIEYAEMRNANNNTMKWLLVGIGAVSLLVGGIGIMNIMLVSVTERTREIGIRLAIGAHGGDVLLQFLIEAVVLSLLGGGLGVALGIGASEFIDARYGIPVAISSGSIALSFGVSALIGVGFGFFPALKAAQLDPIDALRYE